MTIYKLIHFKKNGAGLKNQITVILFKIWPTNRFSKAKSYNFHFHKNGVTCLLVQMAYSFWETIQIMIYSSARGTDTRYADASSLISKADLNQIEVCKKKTK